MLALYSPNERETKKKKRETERELYLKKFYK